MTLSILIPSHNEPEIFRMIDETEAAFPGAQIVVANDRYGRGKGWAIREALSAATGDVVAFIDGDRDIPPRMLRRLIPFLEDYSVIVGRKQVRGLLSRRLLTRLSRLVIFALFGILYDSQTGIKLFLRSALPEWKSDSFAFDVEILTSLRDKGHSIIEVPVEVTKSKPMKGSSIVKCLWEILKIRRDLWEKSNARMRMKKKPESAGKKSA